MERVLALQGLSFNITYYNDVIPVATDTSNACSTISHGSACSAQSIGCVDPDTATVTVDVW